jgi:very-short-patch-repair endonuclease
MTEELNKSMYYGAAPATFQKARQLRNKTTTAEQLLWKRVKGKQICNARFRRQHPISKFIVDFYCHAAKLIIEIDGKIHLKNKEYDKERTDILKSYNLEVIRFSNMEIETNIEKVIKKITLKLKTCIESNR